MIKKISRYVIPDGFLPEEAPHIDINPWNGVIRGPITAECVRVFRGANVLLVGKTPTGSIGAYSQLVDERGEVVRGLGESYARGCELRVLDDYLQRRGFRLLPGQPGD